MKVKTSELIGPALDWAVEEALGGDHTYRPREYSTDWSQGGPIIEREGISIGKADEPDWWAFKGWKDEDGMPGPTPLIAAMRCYVSSKLGDEVDIPDKLME